VGATITGHEHEVVLRDGSRALIRPIRPDDKERLVQGLSELSPRSAYMRFHTPMTHLTDEQLRYLTEIDHVDHMAWVAVDPSSPGTPGMGVARYVRSRTDPCVAEAAVTVVDRYQNRGVGSLLLRVLAESAVANGITTFRNYVLAENTAMLQLIEEIGAELVEEGDGVYRVDLVLAEHSDALPGAVPARILRDIARGAAEPPHWIFPWHATLRAGPREWRQHLLKARAEEGHADATDADADTDVDVDADADADEVYTGTDEVG
jgi:GNAT superfamily N-acetyltransferase